MPREEVHTLLAACMKVATIDRPDDGWGDVPGEGHVARLFALHYEQNHEGGAVASVEEFWVPRGTSAPSIPMAMGLWSDIFLYDAEGKVLAFHRHFLD